MVYLNRETLGQGRNAASVAAEVIEGLADDAPVGAVGRNG
jgi:hypothetical protein